MKSIVGVWLVPGTEPFSDGQIVDVTRLTGQGQGECSVCKDMNIPSEYWKCFLYKFSCFPDRYYCPSHARQMVSDWRFIRSDI